jgi:hypothetical protein
LDNCIRISFFRSGYFEDEVTYKASYKAPAPLKKLSQGHVKIVVWSKQPHSNSSTAAVRNKLQKGVIRRLLAIQTMFQPAGKTFKGDNQYLKKRE